MYPPPPPTTFSVILPTFNRKDLVTRAIDSVLLQNYQDFELIVIDDGSTDGTMEVLAHYDDPRLRILQKENGGVSSARNLGLENARGRYVTFVDSDDYLLQGFFKDAWEFLSQNQVSGLFYGGLTIEDKKTNEIPLFYQQRSIETKCYSHHQLFKDFCLLNGNSWACAKFFDRNLIDAYKIRFCEDITYGEDLNFVLQFLFFVPEVGIKNERFYCCDMRYESLNRGQITMDIQSENLLRSHRKIADILIKNNQEDLLPYLNSLTLMHVSSRYFKKVKRWGGELSCWEKEFREICANSLQDLDFYHRVRNRCVRIDPPILGAWVWSIFNNLFVFAMFSFRVLSKIKRRVLKIFRD